MNTLIDVRDVLPAIRVPALVMHRINDRDANIEEGRFIASPHSRGEISRTAGSGSLDLRRRSGFCVVDQCKSFSPSCNVRKKPTPFWPQFFG
jgi:hypothetical protein